jgi:hypothetical protein
VRVDVVGGVVPQLESLTESSCLKPNLVLSEINLSEAGEDAQRQMHDQSICIFFLPCAVHMREAAELVYSLSVSLIGNSHFSPPFCPYAKYGIVAPQPSRLVLNWCPYRRREARAFRRSVFNSKLKSR